MKTHLISLVFGLFVGLLYGLFGVRSPAPPTVALLGLLGMLAGEHLSSRVQRLLLDPTLDADVSPVPPAPAPPAADTPTTRQGP